MNDIIKYILNQYYRCYRKEHSTVPLMYSELIGESCEIEHEATDCCMLDQDTFLVICQTVYSLEDIKDAVKKQSCEKKKMRGDAANIRQGTVEQRPPGLGGDYLVLLQISILSLFTDLYKQNRQLLKSLVNLLSGKELEDETKVYIQDFSGSCKTTYSETEFGAMIRQIVNKDYNEDSGFCLDTIVKTLNEIFKKRQLNMSNV